ncbi:hypothetical protein C8R45DRAFT_634185 [Mycena sanguinolenta]|nr:hypothetical protein C8R45DRAFT_634185 [Mycena sanguinolenta]
MSIHRESISAVLIVAFFVVASTAQTSALPSHTSSPLLHLHMSPEVRAIVGACIAVGVVLIVVASYFCCCHAACLASRAHSMKKNLDEENQSQQQRDVGVQTLRTSTDKDKDDNDTATTITDAPPSYHEI